MSLPLAGKNGHINMLEIEDFEYVDPFIKMHDIYIANGVWMKVNKQRLQFGEGGFNETEAWAIGGESGHRDFVSHLLEAGAIKFPEPMKKLLTLKKKARQQSCINQLKLTTNLVMSFIYEACKEHEFTYSMYTGRVLPKGINWADVPPMAELEEDGTVSIYGKTPLSEAQVKALIQEQKTVIAKLIDKGSDWHCFVYTMKGVSGKELGQEPHIHYLSSAWGITREKLVNDIKTGKYPNTGNHIPYERYS